MRVVVTGAAGFIGSKLSARLLAEGHTVVGVDCFLSESYDASIKRANVGVLVDDARFELVEADLRSADLRDVFAAADAVVNEAAMPGLIKSWEDVSLYTACNLLALERAVRAARAAGVQTFVQASTSSVYGRFAVGDETMPTEPVSPYGVTKLAAEKLLLAYVAEFGFPATILRYFSIYGPGQRPDMAYHRFAEALLDGRDIEVYGDGHQSRSNTYVDDCVSGTLLALEQGRPGEIYNIGGGESIELLDAVAMLGAALGVEPRLTFHPPRPGDQRETRADTRKAERELGYAAAVTPADGLAAQASWHRARRAEQAST